MPIKLPVAQLIPTDNDAAGRRRIQPAHHVKQGGFTAAGRSDERHIFYADSDISVTFGFYNVLINR